MVLCCGSGSVDVENPRPLRNRIKKTVIDEKIDAWKLLISQLTANQGLTSYGKSKTDYKEIQQVVDYLSKCPYATTETERAWLVFVWISHNIEYDFENSSSESDELCSPEKVVERGLATNRGFSQLFTTLCTNLGVKSRTIEGQAKPINHEKTEIVENHAWNEFDSDGTGKWKLVEITWANGRVEEENGGKKFVKEFEPHYFAKPGDIFLETHYSKSWKPLDATKSLTQEDFVKTNGNKLNYHLLGLSCYGQNQMQALTVTPSNPLVIEYTSPLHLDLEASLFDRGREIENHVIFQSELGKLGEDKSKYCLIATIPERDVQYLLRIYGNEKTSDKDQRLLITEFKVIRRGDSISQIPEYNLSFKYGIGIVSPKSQFISFAGNPALLEFSVPNEVDAHFELTDSKNNPLGKNIFVQKGRNSKFTVNAAVTKIYPEIFFINILAKKGNDKILSPIAKFHLARTQSDEKDYMEFCRFYTAGEDNEDFFIHSPINYKLRGTINFRYFVKDAKDVALIVNGQKVVKLNRDSSQPDTWWVKTNINQAGHLGVYAKFASDSEDYIGLCFYEAE